MTLGPGQTATMICCELDARTGVLRWAHAGHPPPVFLRDGHVRTPTSPDGIMLGVVENFRYSEAVDTVVTRPWSDRRVDDDISVLLVQRTG